MAGLKIQSNSQRHNASGRKLLPSIPALFYACMVSIIFCVLLNIQVIAFKLQRYNLSETKEIWGGVFQKLDGLINSSAFMLLATIVFWWTVGLLLYLVYWLFAKSKQTYDNESSLFSRVVLPVSANSQKIMKQEAAYWALRAVGGLLLVIWIYALLLALSSYHVTRQALESMPTTRFILVGGLQVIVMAVWLLVAMLFLKVALARTRIS